MNDYVAFLLTIGGPIALAISAFTAAFGFTPKLRNRADQAVDPQFIVGMCVVAAVVTILAFYMLSRRVSRIKRILAIGLRTKGKVLEIGFVKDRGRIEFEYTYNGQQHRTGVGVMKNKQTSAISPGDEVEIALDPDDDRKSLLVQLYQAQQYDARE